MCNRYRMTAKQAELAARFGVASPYPEDVTFPPPELFPKRLGWVVRQEGAQRALDVMQWGVPLKMKGAQGQPITKQVTNVRNLSSSFWKSTIGNTDFRCLVPVTDFCEWEGEVGSKQERWFSLPSAPIFAFAGVWRRVSREKPMPSSRASRTRWWLLSTPRPCR
jgi:putative SOS response-associated peptidase YedK